MFSSVPHLVDKSQEASYTRESFFLTNWVMIALNIRDNNNNRPFNPMIRWLSNPMISSEPLFAINQTFMQLSDTRPRHVLLILLLFIRPPVRSVTRPFCPFSRPITHCATCLVPVQAKKVSLIARSESQHNISPPPTITPPTLSSRRLNANAVW